MLRHGCSSHGRCTLQSANGEESGPCSKQTSCSPAINMTTSYIHDSVHSWMVAGSPYLRYPTQPAAAQVAQVGVEHKVARHVSTQPSTACVRAAPQQCTSTYNNVWWAISHRRWVSNLRSSHLLCGQPWLLTVRLGTSAHNQVVRVLHTVAPIFKASCMLACFENTIHCTIHTFIRQPNYLKTWSCWVCTRWHSWHPCSPCAHP
mgnify:CR=1 FL=1